MKKIGFWGLTALLMLGLTVSGAQAFSFLDTTQVQEWRGAGIYQSGAWKNVIGDVNIFDTFGADLSGGKFKITTNWNPTKNGSVDALVKTADFFIDKGNDGSWDLAIRLDVPKDPNVPSELGKIFPATTFNTSFDVFNGKTLIYGGRYDEVAQNPVPVWATSNSTGSTTVTWVYGSGDLNNTVEIDLSALNLTDPWGFVWGTATCANDGFSGVVPVPASVLLLGTGILGLVGVGLRRKS